MMAGYCRFALTFLVAALCVCAYPAFSQEANGGEDARFSSVIKSTARVEPDGMALDTPTFVEFSVRTLPRFFINEAGEKIYDAPLSVEVERIDDKGELLALEGRMTDGNPMRPVRGDPQKGEDPFPGDGVYVFYKTYEFKNPETVKFRVKVTMRENKVYYSDAITMLSYHSITENESNAIDSSLTEASKLYEELLPSVGKEKALEHVVSMLKANSFVRDAGVSVAGSSIWVKYKNGMNGGVLLNPPGTRGIR